VDHEHDNPLGAEYVRQALRAFQAWGDRDAIIADGGTHYTFAQLTERTLSMAAMLWEHGLRPGDTIIALVTNPPESIALQLAAHRIGVRTAWIAPIAPPPFRREFLRRANPQAFIYEAPIFPVVGPRVLGDSGLPVFSIGPSDLGPDLAHAPSVAALPDEAEAVRAEPTSLFQTGGTTGMPKLILHGGRFFAALQPQAQAYLDSGLPPLRHLLVAGTWHVSSQLAAFITLLTGGTLYTQVGVENGAFLRLIESARITSTLVTPPLLYGLLDDPRLAATDTSSLHTFTISGSAGAPARLAEAAARFGPVIRITYGLSEAPFVCALPNLMPDPDHPGRLASCGLPYADAAVQIRDPHEGTVLGPDQLGEICVHGTLVMSEYWHQPELTADAMSEGWLRTGDMGYLDADGYLYVVDRVKDMVVTGKGSTNVYCRPVEDVLLGHPQVRAAAVYGVPDQQVGEAVHASIVLAPDADVTIEQLQELVATELNPTHSPQTVHVVDQLPLTEFGKVDKKALRAAAATPVG
jgi:fatty-acyl-CoA synthase